MRQEGADVRGSHKIKKTAADVEGGGEWINALPEEVLQHVMSFLPAKQAVRTCVLARRWRHLWKSMPVLRVFHPWYLNKHDVRNLNRFMNCLIRYRDRRMPLDTCEIKIGAFGEGCVEPQVDSLIRYALLHKARIMKVELQEHNDNFSLAKLPLISQRLTRLELSNVSLLCGFVDSLSFPALEALWIKCCHIDGEKISSQSLKELTMIDCIFFRQFRISAPSLVRLEITDCVGKAPVLEIMPSLVKAFIRFRDSRDICGKEEFGGSCTNASCDNCGANGVDSGDCVLLKGISMAKSLELVTEPG
ncbi:hypothetical protein EE612_054028, partial [Oryza sativa]